MSQQELKALENRFNHMMKNDPSPEFYSHYQQLKPHLDELERDMAQRNSLVKEKDYEWMKWLVAIAAGVFSVIVTQISKMSLLSIEQLVLLKIAISANALGIVLGAIYLYTDVKHEKDLVRKLQIQRYYLLLDNKKRYENVIHSDRLWFSGLCKPLSLTCFLIFISIWVGFVWQINISISVP